MGKKIAALLMLILSFTLNGLEVTGFAEASEMVFLNDLINNSKYYDGKTVNIQGEALLEVMEREGGAWININDGSNAMGLWLPLVEAGKIKKFGDYHTVGDQLKVEAIFHRSCTEHGGDMDLHFVKWIHLEPGHDKTLEMNTNRILLAVLLTTITAVIGFTFFKKYK